MSNKLFLSLFFTLVLNSKNGFIWDINHFSDNFMLMKKITSDFIPKLKVRQYMRVKFIEELSNNLCGTKKKFLIPYILFFNYLLTNIKKIENIEIIISKICILITEDPSFNNNSICIYYFCHLYREFIKITGNTNRYFNFEQYVEKVDGLLDTFEDYNEQLEFLESNIAFFGCYLNKNIESFSLSSQTIETLIKLYTKNFEKYAEFIINNFENLKEIYFKKDEAKILDNFKNNFSKTFAKIFYGSERKIYSKSSIKENTNFANLHNYLQNFSQIFIYLLKDISLGNLLFGYFEKYSEGLNEINDKLKEYSFSLLFLSIISKNLQNNFVIVLLKSILELIQKKLGNESDISFFFKILEYSKEKIYINEELVNKVIYLFICFLIQIIKKQQNEQSNIFLSFLQYFPDKYQKRIILRIITQMIESMKEYGNDNLRICFYKTINNVLNQRISENTTENKNNLMEIIRAETLIYILKNYYRDNIRDLFLESDYFFCAFLSYSLNNFKIEMDNDLEFRKNLYASIIHILYEHIIFTNGEIKISFIETLISSFFKYIKQYSCINPEDCYIIYTLIYLKIQKKERIKGNILLYKVVFVDYIISFYLIYILFKIYKLPPTIENIFISLIEKLKMIEKELAEIMSKFDFTQFSIGNSLEGWINLKYFINYLTESLNIFDSIIPGDKRNLNDLMNINYILFEGLFGKTTQIKIFFDSQKDKMTKGIKESNLEEFLKLWEKDCQNIKGDEIMISEYTYNEFFTNEKGDKLINKQISDMFDVNLIPKEGEEQSLKLEFTEESTNDNKENKTKFYIGEGIGFSSLINGKIEI